MGNRSLATCLLFSLTLSLRAQQPPAPATTQPAPRPPAPTVPAQTGNASDQDVIRIATNLVQLDVVVTKDGKQVTDLKPDDFEIVEDGKPQPITNFSYVSSTGTRVDYTAPPASAPGKTEAPVVPKVVRPQNVNRTVAIVVDDLGMSFETMARLRSRLLKFVNEKLQPNDLVAIIRTGGDVGALQQFTTDRRALQNAVANLKWNPCSRAGGTVLTPERSLIAVHPPEGQLNGRLPADRSPSSASVQRANTANEPSLCSDRGSLYYTIRSLRFFLRGMAELPGRKSMVIISDILPVERQEMAPVDFGFKRPVREDANIIDVWTQSTSYGAGLDRLAEIAIRSSVVIYGVSSQGLQTLGPHPSDEISNPPLGVRRLPTQDVVTRLIRDRSAELRRNTEGAGMLANQTGGFMVRNTNDFGLEEVLDDQSGYYLIGYRPSSTTFDRRFHHIKARVKRRGLTVRTRAGFYGIAEEEGAPARLHTVREKVDKSLASPFGASEISVQLTPLFTNDPVRGSLLRLFLWFETSGLTFTEEPDGSNVANMALTTVFFGDNGTIAARDNHRTTLRLRGRPLERARREGVVYSFDLPAPGPGVFQFRIAVVDVPSSRVGSAGQFLSIPNIPAGRLALSGILLQANSPTSTTDDVISDATMRRFRQRTALAFGYTIYNATLDSKRLPRLTSQTIVFRDGKSVYTADPVPIDAKDQTDMKRIGAGARLQLGPALTAGEYVLQIVVEDALAKRRAMQWIQFDVVK